MLVKGVRRPIVQIIEYFDIHRLDSHANNVVFIRPECNSQTWAAEAKIIESVKASGNILGIIRNDHFYIARISDVTVNDHRQLTASAFVESHSSTRDRSSLNN
jgi:hypothetical protein